MHFWERSGRMLHTVCSSKSFNCIILMSKSFSVLLLKTLWVSLLLSATVTLWCCWFVCQSCSQTRKKTKVTFWKHVIILDEYQKILFFPTPRPFFSTYVDASVWSCLNRYLAAHLKSSQQRPQNHRSWIRKMPIKVLDGDFHLVWMRTFFTMIR